MGLPEKEILEKVYGESSKSMERFKRLRKKFEENFGHAECEFFSAPGRSEIIGKRMAAFGDMIFPIDRCTKLRRMVHSIGQMAQPITERQQAILTRGRRSIAISCGRKKEMAKYAICKMVLKLPGKNMKHFRMRKAANRPLNGLRTRRRITRYCFLNAVTVAAFG